MTETCTVCKRKPPVYFRRYSGEKLCKKCFCESIEEKVRATIAKYEMLEFNDKTMIAVSGGKDSLTLLRILHKIAGVPEGGNMRCHHRRGNKRLSRRSSKTSGTSLR